MVEPRLPTGYDWSKPAERWVSANSWLPSTKRFYKMVLRQFCRDFPDLPEDHRTVERWVDSLRRIKGAGRRGPLRPLDYTTKTKYYKVIKEFYSWLKYEDMYGGTNPRFRPPWCQDIPDLPYHAFGPNKYLNWRNGSK